MVKYGENEDYSIVGQHPYDTAHVVLPEIMKSLGYNTGMFGKWAGGYEGSASTPDKRGVDEFYGYICQFQAHLYYPNFLNRYSKALGDTAVVREVLTQNIEYPMYGDGYEKRKQYSADMIHQRALKWIDAQSAGQPFFGVLTYTLPHAELAQPNDSILEHYKQKFTDDGTYEGSVWSRYNPVTHTHAQFAAMITRLDSYVGEIMSMLHKKGLADNTIVIFTSDNGPHEEGGADPTFFGRDGKLKGLKRSCHEGGIRVPFIVSWPKGIKPGQESDHILAFYDLMPTFAEIAGVSDVPGTYGNKALETDYFDGISFVPTLTGSGVQKQHDFLYWEFDETDQIALRQGPWKLIVKKGVPELYNLESDLHEDNNLAAQYPQRVRSMVEILLREHTPSAHFSVTLPSL